MLQILVLELNVVLRNTVHEKKIYIKKKETRLEIPKASFLKRVES